MTQSITRLGLLADSGAPEGSTDYTTIVLIHGYGWHSGVFMKLLPIASRHNARVVLVNRQDYPKAKPYTLEERVMLMTAVLDLKTDALAVKEKLEAFMREQAGQIYSLLVQLVAEHKLPAASPGANTGGIVIGGWSFGTTWMMSLLANIAYFPVGEIDLGRYVRRVIFYDPPDVTMGFPGISKYFFPLIDPTIPPEDLEDIFGEWISAYFDHGNVPGQYEDRRHLQSPPPSIWTMTEAERRSTQHHTPGDTRGGMDHILFAAGYGSGQFLSMRHHALRLPPPDAALVGNAWRDVEVRCLWCNRSSWIVPWGEQSLRKEVTEEKNAGTALRPVTFALVRGANHMVHWDEPERALNAVLAAAPASGIDVDNL